MDKEEFKRRLKEQQIFNELKDNIGINTMAQVRYYLLENFLIGQVDARRLYIKLTNYRIKHYGSSILEVSIPIEDRYKYVLNSYDDKKMKGRKRIW